MKEFAMKLTVLLATLLLSASAFAQESSSANVTINWSVSDTIGASGTVAVTFQDDSEDGVYAGTISGSHSLTYSNNQTNSRRIDIEASGIPSGLVLKASATPDSGTGNGKSNVEVGSTKNLITAIPGGTVDAGAQVVFEAEADGPIDGTTITVIYTITGG